MLSHQPPKLQHSPHHKPSTKFEDLGCLLRIPPGLALNYARAGHKCNIQVALAITVGKMVRLALAFPPILLGGSAYLALSRCSCKPLVGP